MSVTLDGGWAPVVPLRYRPWWASFEDRGILPSTMRRLLPSVAFVCLLASAVVGCSDSSTSGGSNATAGNTSTLVSSGGAVAAGGKTNSNQGGATNTGGVVASNGGAVTVGGATGVGGAVNTGGAISSGGTFNTGGAATNGGATSKGGTATTTGGSTNTGGTVTAAGSAGKGGTATGGALNTGGTAIAGGKANTGGTVSAAGAVNQGGTAGATATPSCTGTGWKLVWSDEFNGASGSAVDAKNWTFDVGNGSNGWGNSELEYYTNGTNNAAMDGTGNLVITARKESMGGMAYTSARLKTQGLHAWQYGRIEGRMKIPAGQGIWPAFWMLGNDIATVNWPNCGEIDVMENIGKEPNIIHGSAHGPGYSGGNPLTAQTTLSAAVSSAYHLFAVEWDATSIRWYVDDTLYSTKTNADIPSGTTWVYTHPFFIILNVAVGGTWPGSPDGTTVFPQQMLVDYVRVCQK